MSHDFIERFFEKAFIGRFASRAKSLKGVGVVMIDIHALPRFPYLAQSSLDVKHLACIGFSQKPDADSVLSDCNGFSCPEWFCRLELSLPYLWNIEPDPESVWFIA